MDPCSFLAFCPIIAPVFFICKMIINTLSIKSDSLYLALWFLTQVDVILLIFMISLLSQFLMKSHKECFDSFISAIWFRIILIIFYQIKLCRCTKNIYLQTEWSSLFFCIGTLVLVSQFHFMIRSLKFNAINFYVRKIKWSLSLFLMEKIIYSLN